MDLRFWASFSVICILLHCCQLCESRPRPGMCRGLIKGHKNCPASSIGFSKRLLDAIMKRTDDGTATDDDALWEDELRKLDDNQFDERQPYNDWGLGAANEDTPAAADLASRDSEEELRRKELELLFVRALLDDLENETFDDM